MSNLDLRKINNPLNRKKIDNFLLNKSVKVEKLVIMTLGNVLHSDDGVGPMIYEELNANNLNQSILLINAELNPEKDFKTILSFKPTHIIIIGGIEANLEPGTVLFFKNLQIQGKLFTLSSSHRLSLLEINNYLLKQNKEINILNIGIQVKSTEFGFQTIEASVYDSACNLKDYLLKILSTIFHH